MEKPNFSFQPKTFKGKTKILIAVILLVTIASSSLFGVYRLGYATGQGSSPNIVLDNPRQFGNVNATGNVESAQPMGAYSYMIYQIQTLQLTDCTVLRQLTVQSLLHQPTQQS